MKIITEFWDGISHLTYDAARFLVLNVELPLVAELLQVRAQMMSMGAEEVRFHPGKYFSVFNEARSQELLSLRDAELDEPFDDVLAQAGVFYEGRFVLATETPPPPDMTEYPPLFPTLCITEAGIWAEQSFDWHDNPVRTPLHPWPDIFSVATKGRRMAPAEARLKHEGPDAWFPIFIPVALAYPREPAQPLFAEEQAFAHTQIRAIRQLFDDDSAFGHGVGSTRLQALTWGDARGKTFATGAVRMGASGAEVFLEAFEEWVPLCVGPYLIMERVAVEDNEPAVK